MLITFTKNTNTSGYADTVFRSIFEESPFSIQIMSPDGSIRHVNKAWEKLFRASDEMIRGYNILQNEQLQESGIIPFIKRGLAGEKTSIPVFRYDVGSEVIGKRIRWLRAIIYPVMDKGSISEVVLKYEDVTEQEETRNIQQERKNQLQTITDSLPALIGVLDRDLRYRYCNKTYETWLGMPIDKIIGKPIREIIGHVAFDRVKEKFDLVLEGKVEKFDGYLVYANGTERYVSSTMIPKLNNELQVEEIYLLVLDRTPYKKAEEKAIHHHNELAHLARVSTISELATGLAHELNQPLATIKLLSRIGLLQLDADVTDHDKLRDSLDNIGAQAMRAGEIIRHLRRLIAKKNPQKGPVKLNDLISETISFIGTEIREVAVTVELDLAEDLPEVFADRIQIQQVLINLLLNCIDAIRKVNSNNGKVTIATRNDNMQRAVVTVTDTGCGMDEDTLDSMFNSFFSTKGEMGIGIGLSICRSLVESHDGEIHAKSTPGTGTTLTFTLPFA